MYEFDRSYLLSDKKSLTIDYSKQANEISSLFKKTYV